MPYVMVQTNAEMPSPYAFMSRTSAFLAEKLGKPESYVMVAIEPKTDMMFAGTPDLCAYAEVKSIGLTESQTGELSDALCTFLGNELGVGSERVYVEFSGVPATMWGWNNRTFA
jgi:phenylpyruvate tautomerase PptA (4-oxalocrotonate tautomerase family)